MNTHADPPLAARRRFLQTQGTGALAWSLGAASAVGLGSIHRSGFGQTPAARAYLPTPSQTEGPFYPDEALQDTDFDLLRNGNASYAMGQPAWVGGVVTDLQGRPVAGAAVEIWQCDHDGVYRQSQSSGRAGNKMMVFQGFGKVAVGADGRYKFRTIKPVPYPGRTPHIHFCVKLGGRELLTTQLYVRGEPANSRDALLRRLSSEQRGMLDASFEVGKDGLTAEFAIRVLA